MVRKIYLAIALVILIAFSICYYHQRKFQKRCTKKYTICYIENVRNSMPDRFKPIMTGKLYADCYMKIEGKTRGRKNMLLHQLYTEKIGWSEITKEGYYFIDYCAERTHLHTIYADLIPLDVDPTFLDSSWKTYREMKFYTMPLKARNIANAYNDSISRLN